MMLVLKWNKIYSVSSELIYILVVILFSVFYLQYFVRILIFLGYFPPIHPFFFFLSEWEITYLTIISACLGLSFERRQGFHLKFYITTYFNYHIKYIILITFLSCTYEHCPKSERLIMFNKNIKGHVIFLKFKFLIYKRSQYSNFSWNLDFFIILNLYF